MQTITSSVTAAILAGVLAISSAVPTQAQSLSFGFGERNRVIETYCDRYPNDRDCRGYYGGRWNDDDYDRFYRGRQSNLDAIASGFFGFTFGAILGSALSNSNNNRDRVIYLDDDEGRYVGSYEDHVDACYARYRSYDERTDSFLGYDGVRHRCNL